MPAKTYLDTKNLEKLFGLLLFLRDPKKVALDIQGYALPENFAQALSQINKSDNCNIIIDHEGKAAIKKIAEHLLAYSKHGHQQFLNTAIKILREQIETVKKNFTGTPEKLATTDNLEGLYLAAATIIESFINNVTAKKEEAPDLQK